MGSAEAASVPNHRRGFDCTRRELAESSRRRRRHRESAAGRDRRSAHNTSRARRSVRRAAETDARRSRRRRAAPSTARLSIRRASWRREMGASSFSFRHYDRAPKPITDMPMAFAASIGFVAGVGVPGGPFSRLGLGVDLLGRPIAPNALALGPDEIAGGVSSHAATIGGLSANVLALKIFQRVGAAHCEMSRANRARGDRPRAAARNHEPAMSGVRGRPATAAARVC